MPSIKYRNKEYSCDYLDWYKKSLDKKLTRPNCVIHHDNVFKSSINNFEECGPVIGMNLSTSAFGNYSKTMQMQLDASIQLDKVMIILPMNLYYPLLMFWHTSRTILQEADIFMLTPGKDGKLVEKTHFRFFHSHIDHISLENSKEIILLLSPKSIVITNILYDEMNTKIGKSSYELFFDTANFAWASGAPSS
ncbi:MAG: hypothetical protein H6850_02660 [Alphaproteobacteria bacterium]|nr:MAG: hypothetical protein H6850_02660 [Alphaproteobacteria bacterium]